MGKARKIDFGGVPEDIRKRGRNVPEGDYLGKITAVERKQNQAGDAYYFSWTFQILADANGKTKFKGTPMYFITSLKPDALFNLRNLIFAATKKNVAGKSLDFDPESLIGKKIGMTIEDEEFEDKNGNARIKSKPQDVFHPDQLEGDSDSDDDDDDDEVEEVEEEEEPTSKKKNKKGKKGKKMDKVDIDDDL